MLLFLTVLVGATHVVLGVVARPRTAALFSKVPFPPVAIELASLAASSAAPPVKSIELDAAALVVSSPKIPFPPVELDQALSASLPTFVLLFVLAASVVLAYVERDGGVIPVRLQKWLKRADEFLVHQKQPKFVLAKCVATGMRRALHSMSRFAANSTTSRRSFSGCCSSQRSPTRSRRALRRSRRVRDGTWLVVAAPR